MDPVTPSGTRSETSPESHGDEDPTDVMIRVDPAEISSAALPVADGEQLPPGTMLGEYRLGELIGKGGMGFVYAAAHPLIGKRAAVKILRRELCRDPLTVSRFIDEARVVNRIGHPNIVDVFAFGQTPDGRSYFVMEWLKGETLRARVARSRLEVDEIRGIVKALTSALSAAHAQGVVHRDLKPDNVFLVVVPGQETVVKLLDFGVAKLDNPHRVEQTASGMIVGTPQYLSPEQAKNMPIDARADTYALGAILFELITGRPPFLASSAMEVVAMHLMEEPPRPSELVPVPPAIDELVVTMLGKTPEERPPLGEVTARFEQAVWPAAAAQISAVQTGAALRRRRLVMMASGLVVGLAIAAFFVWRSASSGEDSRPAEGVNPVPATATTTAANAGTTANTATTANAATTTPTTDPGNEPAAPKLAGATPAPVPGPGVEAAGSSTRARTQRTKPAAPRTPAAAPAPTTQTLRLVVEAVDFVAKIDGKRVGTSIELAPGTYRLRVCARGKRPYERAIEIKSSDVTWRVELEPLRDEDLQCRE